MSRTHNKSHENKNTEVPHGTRPSVNNAQLLTSTGIPSLDNFIDRLWPLYPTVSTVDSRKWAASGVVENERECRETDNCRELQGVTEGYNGIYKIILEFSGGGLPIGSILLLEEDIYGFYSKIMLKYFLAEGCASSHELFIASQDMIPEQLVMELPAEIKNENHSSPIDCRLKPTSDKMQIAWRYQNMRISDSPSSNESDFGHCFDVTKKLNSDTIAKTHTTYWYNSKNECRFNGFKNHAYSDLLTSIQRTLKERSFYVSTQCERRSIMRIGILSLGSRLWITDDDCNHSDLLKFLYCLRAVLRSCFAVAAITVPIRNFKSNNEVEKIEHLVDTVVSLESFTESMTVTNSVYKDYHGLLHLKKLSAINTLDPFCPQTFDFGFKLRRKRFAIEILHLPPHYENSEHVKDIETRPIIGCETSQNLLSF